MDRGALDAVLRPIKSGKEADLFLVECAQEHYVAKVYKERRFRSFKNDCNYREGRTVRNSRSRRALTKNSKYGRKLAETAWHNAEVDALRRLAQVGVRVPQVHSHHDRVVIMEMICDEHGHLAPQLAQVSLTPAQALRMYDKILAQVVLLLCNDLIHADLSPYNVLVRDGEPVIIDLPQCVSAAHNQQAARMLERDVHAISQFLGLVEPSIIKLGEHAWQLWAEYEAGKLHPGFRPNPRRKRSTAVADLGALVQFVRSTRDEQLLEKRAANGDVEARALLKAAERRAAKWARKEAAAAEAAREEERLQSRKQQQAAAAGTKKKKKKKRRRGRNSAASAPAPSAGPARGKGPARQPGPHPAHARPRRPRRNKGSDKGRGASRAPAASCG